MSQFNSVLCEVITGGKRYYKARADVDEERGVATVKNDRYNVVANLSGFTSKSGDTWNFADGTVRRLPPHECACGGTQVSDV